MLDVSVAYNRYRFLGHEFLTWLWFMIDNQKKSLVELDDDLSDIYIGNRVVLENNAYNREETITIKGDGAGLEEGLMALSKGAKVTEMNLAVRSGEFEWRFNLRGESLNIGGLKPPETGKAESEEDIEGAVLEKIYLYEKMIRFSHLAYQAFLKRRLSEDWEKKEVPRIAAWIGRSSRDARPQA